MTTDEQIEAHLAAQPEPKQSDLRALDRMIRAERPDCRRWFSDGRNPEGKIVANPTLGYGSYTIRYADGSQRESFRIGLSANKSGISVYVLGLDDKKALVTRFGGSLGKATVTGYCIRFASNQMIDLDVLREAVRFGFDA